MNTLHHALEAQLCLTPGYSPFIGFNLTDGKVGYFSHVDPVSGKAEVWMMPETGDDPYHDMLPMETPVTEIWSVHPDHE